MAPCEHTQLSWEDALAILRMRVPGFSTITRPEQLSFDSVASIMSAVPVGFQRIVQDDSDELETFVSEKVLPDLLARTQEVIVIQDCGMVSRLPFRLAAGNVIQFLERFEREEDGLRCGLFDGVSDILFVFDHGGMLLIDHDERIWFSPGREGAK